MRIKTLPIAILFFLCAVTAWAQQPATMTNREYMEYLRALFAEGNDNYASTGNKLELKRIIGAYEEALTQRRQADLMTKETYDSLAMLRLNKLQGDYHYLNADEDERSYAEAERRFRQSLEFAQDPAHRTYQTVNHDIFILYQELGQLYYKQGEYEKAWEEMEHAYQRFTLYYSDIDDEVLDFMSQHAICQARVAKDPTDYGKALEEINFVIEYYQNTDTERFGEALRKKAKILMLQQETGMGMGEADTTALNYYRQYFTLKKTDALQHFEAMSSEERELYWMRIRPFVTDCYRLEDTDPSFLYNVALFSKGLLLELNREGGGQQALNAGWRDVQATLRAGDCAIEFIQYEKYGRQLMGALVLGKTGAPQFVRMTDPDEIMHHKIVGRDIETRLKTVSSHSQADKNNINFIYFDATLKEMIWKPELVSAIGDAKHVWFAPDSYQHRLAIEYLLPEDVTGFRCHRLTSTRILLKRNDPSYTNQSSGRALLVGGVSYAYGESLQDFQNDQIAYSHFRELKTRFDSLCGSIPEIQSILQSRDNPEDRALIGTAASEQGFRSLCSSFPIIHVSSHGLFSATAIPLGTDLRPCLTDESLSQSVLAFSGVASYLKDASFDPNDPDGLLSAKEISSFDLSQTDLVILCCCETGLGFITADGVYGIQRGLKNAGVKSILVTLWDIDDNASRFFMSKLHEQLMQGVSLYDAFYNVRDLMSAEEEFNYPVFRDPFILIDAI